MDVGAKGQGHSERTRADGGIQFSNDDGVTELLQASSAQLSKTIAEQRSAIATVREESSDESTVISSQTSTLTRNRGPEEMEQYGQKLSESESDDDLDDLNCTRILHGHIGSAPFAGLTRASEESRFTHDGGTVRIMYNKETNTDWCEQQVAVSQSRQPVAASNSQLRTDASHGTSIRRWQTFTPAAVTDDVHVCKLNRSDSDSKVRPQQFERQSADRKMFRVKKSSSLQQSRACNEPRHKVRTSLDLELDLQAYKVQQARLNEEIATMKECKRFLEEAKSRGSKEAVDRLSKDARLQQCLQYVDQQVPCHEAACRGTDQELAAHRRLSRVSKDIEKRIQCCQNDELAFRKKMSFFTRPQTSHVSVVSDLSSATGVVSQQPRIITVHHPPQVTDCRPVHHS